MIEACPVLAIRRPVRRPTDAQIAAFADTPTSFIVDAMAGQGALAAAIAPLSTELPQAAHGPALTVNAGPGDCLATLAAPAFTRPGDMVLIGVAGHQGCAALGDRVLGALRNAGAAGAVTDGPARDLDGIVTVGLPVWAAGLTPNSPMNTGPGEIGLPVQMGGRQVETGDMVIADRDGVVTVPFDLIDRVIGKLDTIRHLEGERDARVANGLIVTPDIEALLASESVAWVD
ncbi:RraA family protein [Ovoidimarina sediminis]|uniref:RraA family protein n=1 Tax=Ovoidimarina sediminis TaxID=3079856 RepID=UPI00290A65F5|nr:RraA family protein [Rhodophyticola sp. MJ-SS7]MDU8943362.1 RraA family protein [Rhodophyticola sp. MJ-SS7]